MISIAIPYYSGSGHTRKLAEFVLEGILNIPSIKAELFDISNLSSNSWKKLHEANAIIFGCPTYMGNVSGAFKLFMDETSDFWVEQMWADKIAAGFTVGSSPSGDKLNSLVQMSIFAAQHGMIWVGQNQIGSFYTKDDLRINEAGSYLGLMALSDRDKSKLISDYDARTATLFGERIANATKKWQHSSNQ
ncbi:MAG: flavodoxin family protein [Rhizobiales bacterium]|nr:flavodoxin family protein [Hyphomicrobiales bacterium]